MSRSIFLRCFDDPRLECTGLSREGMQRRDLPKTDKIVGGQVGGSVDSSTCVVGSVFLDAIRKIVRHKNVLKTTLLHYVNRRLQMSRKERIQLIKQQNNSRTNQCSQDSKQRRAQLTVSTSMRSKNVFQNHNLLKEERRQKLLVQSRANYPQNHELEQILKGTPFSLEMTRKEWDSLLAMARPITKTHRAKRVSVSGEEMVPWGMCEASVEALLQNVHRMLLKSEGKASWNGKKTNMRKDARIRQQMKEEKVRRRPPYVNRIF